MKKVMTKIDALVADSGIEEPTTRDKFSLEYTQYLEETFNYAYTPALSTKVVPNQSVFGVVSLYKGM